MTLDDLVQKLIPAAVIFADCPEHVADLRQRAKAAIQEWMIETADMYWWADDPERNEDAPRELALAHEWSPGEVYQVMRASRLPDAYIVCWNTPDEDVDAREFATEAEAAAFAANLASQESRE